MNYNDYLKVSLPELLKNLKDKKQNIHFMITCEPGTRIYDIIEGFLIHEAIKLYPNALKIFKSIKKNSEINNMKGWYKQFASIEPCENLDLTHFPTIKINNERLDSEISKFRNKINSNYKINTEDSILIENNLITKIIRCSVLGLPSAPKKWYSILEHSRGESILRNCNDIAFIDYDQKPLFSKNFDNGFVTFPSHNKFKNIPKWLNYKITNGTLILYGFPKKEDIGKFTINIYNYRGLIFRQYGISVESTNELSELGSGITMSSWKKSENIQMISLEKHDCDNSQKSLKSPSKIKFVKTNVKMETEKNDLEREKDYNDFNETLCQSSKIHSSGKISIAKDIAEIKRMHPSIVNAEFLTSKLFFKNKK